MSTIASSLSALGPSGFLSECYTRRHCLRRAILREKLAKAGLIEKLFDRFDQHLAAKGYMARGGQMVDATIVPVPKQRNRVFSGTRTT